MDKRAAGILMPITSLPSEYGIGCFSKSAYEPEGTGGGRRPYKGGL